MVKGGGSLPRRILCAHGLLFLAMVVGFSLAIGGVSGSRSDCLGNNCNNSFRYTWWIIAYTFLTWVAMAILIFRQNLIRYQLPMVAFLVLGASQTMPLADTNLQQWNRCISYAELGCDTRIESNLSAAAAGFIIISICNFIWIVLAGSMKDSAHDRGHGSPTSSNSNPSELQVEKKKIPTNNPQRLDSNTRLDSTQRLDSAPSIVTRWEVPSPIRQTNTGRAVP